MRSSARHLRILGAAACLCGFLFITAGDRGDAATVRPVELRLTESAQVDGPDIVLEDIADIICADPHQAEKVGQLVVAKAPLPGQSRKLRSSFIALRLRQYELDSDRVKITGAPATKVTARSMEVKAEQVRRIVSEFVEKADLWGSADTTITDIQIGPDRTFPPGRLSYRVVSSKGLKKSGLLRLSVMFEVDGWFRKSVPAVVRISVMRDVVVARRPIGRYKPITDEDIKLQRMDLTDLPAHIFTGIGEIIGKRAKRKIPANSVLRQDMIETPPLVHRGSMVLIVAESGGLKVTTLGEVKSSGYLGQRVKVMNLDSKKKIFARVVDENTVRVDF